VKYANSITLPVRIVGYVKSAMSAKRRRVMSKQFITKAHYPKGKDDINIYTIHPRKSDLILFYEVVTPEGENEWGGASAEQAIQWLSLAPKGARVLVSAWDSDEEDAHLVGQTIDITEIIQEARQVGR
jgi:hypothetical protein